MMAKMLLDESLYLRGSLRVQVDDEGANYRGPVVLTTYGAAGGLRALNAMKPAEARALALVLIEAAYLAEEQFGAEVDEAGDTIVAVDLVDNREKKRPKIRSLKAA